MSTPLDVIVAGELYVDMIMSGFDFWPRPGTEAFAKEYRRDMGGGATITACGLAKLGMRAAIFGIVGSDSGDWMAGRFKQAGVDASLLRTDAVEPTGFTVAATTPEDRAFLTYAGANHGFPQALLDAAASSQLQARHIHLGFAPRLDTAAELFRAIRQYRCTISIDVGWHEDWLADPRALAILKNVDVFFPNEVEAHAMTREDDPAKALKRFADAGLDRVALKLGARGAALLWRRDLYFAPPPAVTPVDTTGAGDCFDAGFLHAWLNNETPQQCLITGNICGALSTEGYGGIAAFPTPDRLNQELKKGPACTKWQ